jgi:hypothetical protein
MASAQFAPDSKLNHRPSLAEIDRVVSVRLGPTRGLGNSQPACFNRQIAMYLASHVGRWSTTIIGRFYNGRDHSTVSYGVQRIESLHESDPEIDALICDLKRRLCGDRDVETVTNGAGAVSSPALTRGDLERLADLISERLVSLLETKMQHLSTSAACDNDFDLAD